MADCSGSANNKLNVLTCVERDQCNTNHSPNSMSLQHSNIQKSHIWIIAGFPHILKNYFPHFFNTKFNKFNTITSLYFSKILIMNSIVHIA